MTGALGVQITPWSGSRELVALGQRLAPVVDTVWVQDQMLARNVYALLGALAQAGCGVGTNVTYPIGRNPIEMASSAATLAEVVPDGREVIVGMGTGGAIVNSLFQKDRPISAVREAIVLMRDLWAGSRVELDRFPTLGQALSYKPGAVAELTYGVERPPCIVLAGVGPRILAVAGEHADGLISPSNMPTLSRAAFRTGRFGEISGLDRAMAARPASMAPLRLIFGINTSISTDRKRAREHARRQVALVVGNPRLWPDLERVGLDLESAGAVKDAFDAGLGIDGAAAQCSDDLADALIVSGTPEECVPAIAELRDLAAAEGYTEFYVGAPLGPDPHEAAGLLIDQVIPQVWPGRASR
ncbi:MULTISPECIES: LLM class flavin-dependent oxidoreductase [unclassified Nocardioides]|uniref:LLM class flavin-dependent oxidoreductase n=1 Tax=unclassified Nocardioides TaxID=2615069 RepID=UPI0000571A76|nr:MULTISPECIES: LLM class flavin-dependent oxidoreductase [unclassified Nocardioides]ABL80379.1 Coenzyme F420-dependent N5 N10-methylene tetrahydromethanopterin reductase and related flavin-dependent oxidoreductases-like protein [Nocardioides sp. JS614]